MDQLPNFGLANTITGFATLFSGLMPLAFCYLVDRHPPRWMLVYWLIVVTGVFTITLHGFGETNPVFGQRWFWAFLDTGSNIVVTWAIVLAALADFYSSDTQKWARPLATFLMLVGVAWHFYDRYMSGSYLIGFGQWGGFKPGQSWLIAFSLAATILFYVKRKSIPPRAMPLLQLVTALFVCGLLLATAKNDNIVYPFLSLHALWHLVGAFGFIALWAFNDVRFVKSKA
ncbi:MAG: hypothetical protein K8S25_01340 [Alphaproteobacteria bacterium]|nr:hypothetical protein [Alphaproteobacteria bacterium]